MFHQSTEQEIKETVIRSFKKTESTCRVVIATIVLGMGMNFPDVRRVVNYETPNSLEQYVQQCGRAGRDHSICAVMTAQRNVTALRHISCH